MTTDDRRTPNGNADDPTADRLAAYPEAGELHSDQGATQRVGQETGPDTAPSGPEMTGADAELLQAGGPGDRLGGPHATDRDSDPGLPGHDQPAEGGRAQAEDGEARIDTADDGSLVDRLDR